MSEVRQKPVQFVKKCQQFPDPSNFAAGANERCEAERTSGFCLLPTLKKERSESGRTIGTFSGRFLKL